MDLSSQLRTFFAQKALDVLDRTGASTTDRPVGHWTEDRLGDDSRSPEFGRAYPVVEHKSKDPAIPSSR
jgi:hypothetical protein